METRRLTSALKVEHAPGGGELLLGGGLSVHFVRSWMMNERGIESSRSGVRKGESVGDWKDRVGGAIEGIVAGVSRFDRDCKCRST
jgi:hypothetical protein